MPDRYIDTVSDFDRAADELPVELRDELDSRQRAVAAARDRAQANEDLMRMRVQGSTVRREPVPQQSDRTFFGRLKQRLLRATR